MLDLNFNTLLNKTKYLQFDIHTYIHMSKSDLLSFHNNFKKK